MKEQFKKIPKKLGGGMHHHGDKAFVLVIDPGLAGSGFALFDALEFNKEATIATPCITWVKTLKSADRYYSEIRNTIKHCNVVKVFCEGQALMNGSEKGAVTSSSGALVKLANFAGGIMGLCYMMETPYRWVKVIDWKGQLPKDVVMKRIKRAWPKFTCTTHDWDAVGMGIHVQKKPWLYEEYKI